MTFRSTNSWDKSFVNTVCILLSFYQLICCQVVMTHLLCCTWFLLLALVYNTVNPLLMPLVCVFVCVCVQLPLQRQPQQCEWLQAYSRHSLSTAALVTAGAPIFLLDAFTQIILYYTPGYPPSIPFPPPHSSLLRRTIQALKQHRQITPRVRMLRGANRVWHFRAF